MSWISPIVDGFSGLNQFFGLTLPILLWICLALFLVFLLVGLARKLSVTTIG